MSEIINTYKLDNPDILVPMDRAEFYQEQTEVYKKIGKPNRSVEVVNIFIFNSRGELIIQKRSFNKNHNPGLLDKSVGGHLQNNDSLEYTAVVEMVQELQTPSIILKDEVDFQKSYNILKKFLETIALVRYLSTDIINPVKIINDEKIKIANRAHIFLGVYDGRIRPADQEAKGILFYSLSDLMKEMKENSDIFSDDLRIILREHEEDIKKFIAYITQ